jgi:hypothetical protein
MILSDRSMCIVPYQGSVLPLFILLLKILLWSIWYGMKRRHTCIAYVVKSKTEPKEEQIIHSDQDVSVCGKYMDERCMETPLYMISIPFEMFFF